MCMDDATSAAVRCCADVDISVADSCAVLPPTGRDDGCSASICAEIAGLYGGGWNNPAGRGDANVCGETDNGLGVMAGGADHTIDGLAAQDNSYAVYYHHADYANAAGSNVWPAPSTTNTPWTAFSTLTTLVLGAVASSDATFQQDRHFHGDFVGLIIYPDTLSDNDATCLFQQTELMIPLINVPVPAAACSSMLTTDAVATGCTVNVYGTATFSDMGLATDGGAGNYADIADFDYETDGSFSLSFWFQKGTCTANAFEYVYAHNQDAAASILATDNSNINLYSGCAGVNGHTSYYFRSIYQSAGGAGAGVHAYFDFQYSDVAGFDAVTETWISYTVSISPTSADLYLDGVYVAPADLTTHNNAAINGAANGAIDFSSGFNFASSIYLASTANLRPIRHYSGYMAGLGIYSDSLSYAEAYSLFSGMESSMPLPPDPCAGAIDVAEGGVISIDGHGNNQDCQWVATCADTSPIPRRYLADHYFQHL